MMPAFFAEIVMRLRFLLPVFILAFGGVAYAADPLPPAKPLPHTSVIIDAANGPAKFDVEIAGDWRSQEYGLMNRKSLPKSGGMLFDFHSPVMTSFWMKNTLIPLDMIFIRQDGRVSSVTADAVPMSLTSIPSIEPIRAVLEIDGGESLKLGIYPGQKVHAAIFAQGAKTH
ncbi:MAG TPA: DUF192 domain-containing protein [Rhizomicrobium sp.]|jgi:hypothetical protein